MVNKQNKKPGSQSSLELPQNLSLIPDLIDDVDKIVSIAEDAGVPPINLANYKVDQNIIRIVPEHAARNYQILPLAKMGPVLSVAMADPFEVFVMDNLKSITGYNIQPVVASAEQIKKAQEVYYGSTEPEQTVASEEVAEEEIEEEIEEELDIVWQAAKDDVFDVKEMTRSSQDTSIINMVNGIIRDAIDSRASDIHIEPYADILRLRFRVDGVMQDMTPLFRENMNAIMARIKIMSGMDITIRRLPQDGRFSTKFEDRQIDFRVSILPIQFGEKAVLRLLDKGSIKMELQKLGFSDSAFKAFKLAVARPYGMILLTGPTGSGKSTTLYALLNRLNTSQKHLVTVEDPVEYQIDGLTQIQVKPDIGLNFTNCLRAVLRQSPDVIMVGEIRDFETVDIAMKAALTGHILLSTLHTNDAPSAIARLMDMQVEPFLISATLILVAAQRLVRRICPECKQPHEVPSEKLTGLPKDFKSGKVVFYKGQGCSNCSNTGYLGRVAVVEAMAIDDTIRQMILNKAPIDQIRDYARKQGMLTLREDAIEKGIKGEIPLEEILRVTPEKED